MTKRIWRHAIVVALVAAGCGSGGGTVAVPLGSAPAQVVIALHDPDDVDEIDDLREDFAGLGIERIGESPFFLLRVPPGTDLNALLAGLDDDVRVVGSDLDYFGQAPEGGPSDVPILGSDLLSSIRTQPALAALGLAAAHARSTGGGVLVAVVDSGVDLSHPYLAGRILPGGFDFVGGDPDPTDVRNGRDDDGDGLVDEQYGHGTFVASLVLAVAPDAMLLPVRVLDGDGIGTASSVAAGILWAVSAGARVINVSVDIPQSPEVVKEAIDAAKRAGVVVVAAAGNHALNVVIWPARYSEVLAVSASDGVGVLAPFSNRGSDVDLVAPGVLLVGAMPLDLGLAGTARWSGTSFAAPLVAGAAALVLSLEPGFTPSEVIGRLRETALPVDGLNPGLAGRLGSGLVRPSSAIGH